MANLNYFCPKINMLPLEIEDIIFSYYWSHYYYVKRVVMHCELRLYMIKRYMRRELTLYYYLF